MGWRWKMSDVLASAQGEDEFDFSGLAAEGLADFA